MKIARRIKDALTGPASEEVREQYSPAGECPNCGSDDYWQQKGRVGTMYRCLNCRSEGMGPK